MNNFQEVILQLTSFKMSPTPNSGRAFWFSIFRSIINMSHLCKLLHRKKVLQIFKNLFLKKGIREYWCVSYWVYFKLLFKWQLGLNNLNEILKNRYYEFSRWITKIIIYLLQRNSDYKRWLKKGLETGWFWNMKETLKCSNPYSPGGEV